MIGPGEQSSKGPDFDAFGAGAKLSPVVDAMRPAYPSPSLAVFLGVLKPDSALVAVFSGRVVPLRHQHPVLAEIPLPDGKVGGCLCMLIPFSGLTLEHKKSFCEWFAREMQMPLEAGAERLEKIGFIPVNCGHFSGVVRGSKKKTQ